MVPGKIVTTRRKPPDEDERQALHNKANELCRIAVSSLYEGIGKGLYRDIADPDPIRPAWYDYWGLLGPKAILLGVGAASGEDSSRRAVMRAFSNPFLLRKWKGLRNLDKILVNITAGASACLSYQNVRDAVRLVSHFVDNDAYIICAVSTEDTLAEEFRIALLAEELSIQ